MKLSRVGVDLAKNVFQVHGVDRHDKVVWRRRLTRKRWLSALMAQTDPGCEIGMEACASAHHWAAENSISSGETFAAITGSGFQGSPVR
jgi:transposase